MHKWLKATGDSGKQCGAHASGWPHSGLVLLRAWRTDRSIWPRRKAVLKEGSLVLDTSACHIHGLSGLRGSQGKSCGIEKLVLVAEADRRASEMKARGIWTMCPSAFSGTWYDDLRFLFITKNKIWNRNKNIQQMPMFQLCRINKDLCYLLYFICVYEKAFMYSRVPFCDLLSSFSSYFSVFELPSRIWWKHLPLNLYKMVTQKVTVTDLYCCSTCFTV